MAGRSWLQRVLVRVPPSEPAPHAGVGQRADAGAHADSGGRGGGHGGLGSKVEHGADAQHHVGGSGHRSTAEHHPVQYLAFEPTAFRRAVVFVLVAISVWLLAIWAFHATAHFLFLILLAWLIAIAMEPAIVWLIRHGLPRIAATGVTGTVGIIVVLGVGALFGTEFAQQVSQLANEGPQIVANAVAWANSTFHLSLDPTKISGLIDLQSLANYGTAVAQGAFGILGTLGSIIFDALTVVVFAFYFAASGPSLLKYIAAWLPPDKQEVFGTVWETSTVKTGGYVVSKLILIILSTFFHAIFFYVLGLPGWLALALLTGVTSQLVPLVGTYIGVVAAVLVAVFVDPIDALWVVVFATVYQQIENYVFTPRVSNRTMQVSPAIALAAVFVGVGLWGPVGALIGIPLAAAVVSLLETYGRRYELVDQIADAGAEQPKEGGDDGSGEQQPD